MPTTAISLRRFEISRLPQLMAWFPDREACHVWGGVEFRFPFTAFTFREDSKVDSLSSWMLIASNGTMLGFGQYYLRVGRCHLGRLAVAPQRRGSGLGEQLVRGLCAKGQAELGVDGFSLFVANGNDRATRLYERLGFTTTEYPEDLPQAKPYRYMVASHLKPATPSPSAHRS